MSKRAWRSVKQVGDEVFLDENSDYDPDVDNWASIGSDTSSVSVRQGVQHLPTETWSDTELDQPQPSTSTGRGHGPPCRYSDFVFYQPESSSDDFYQPESSSDDESSNEETYQPPPLFLCHVCVAECK